MSNIGKNTKMKMICSRSFVGCFLMLLSVCVDAQTSLKSLPMVSRIWVGTERALLTSAHHKEYYSLGDGEVVVFADDGQWLEKGEHWVTLDPENLRLERDSLQLDKEKRDLQFEEYLEQEDNKILGLKKSFQELQEKGNDLSGLLQEEGLSAVVKNKIAEAQKEVLKQQGRIKEKMKPESLQLKRQLKQRELDLAFQKKERILNTLIRNSELKAPFSGRLSFQVKSLMQSKGEKKWLDGNTQFATLTDDRHCSIEVTPSPGSSYKTSLKNLMIMLAPDSDGFAVLGDFEQVVKVKAANQSMERWMFAVKAEHAEQAALSMGVTRVAHVFRKLDEPAHMVMKKDLFSKNPEVLKRDGWGGLIKSLWPDAQIVFIGPQSIALKQKPAEDGD